MKMLDMDKGTFEVVTTEQAATADYCVCWFWTTPPFDPLNRRRRCFACSAPLQHHPTSPKNVRVVCVNCMNGIIGRH